MTRQRTSPVLCIHVLLLHGLILVLISSGVSGNFCMRTPIRMFIQRAGCLPKAFIAFGCAGACSSYARPSPESPLQLENYCKCCEADDYVNRVIILQCYGSIPSEIGVNINMVTSCRCRPCSNTPDDFIPADSFLNHGKRAFPMLNSNDTFESNDTVHRELFRPHRPFIRIEDSSAKLSLETL